VLLACIDQAGVAALPASSDTTETTIPMRATTWSRARGHRLDQWASTLLLWTLAVRRRCSRDVIIGLDAISSELSPPLHPNVEGQNRLLGYNSLQPTKEGEEVLSTVSADCWCAVIGPTGSVCPWRSKDAASASHTNSLGIGVSTKGEGTKFNMHGRANVVVRSVADKKSCFVFSMSLSSHGSWMDANCVCELYQDAELVRTRSWCRGNRA
jgi:hypothetical protein